MAWRSSTRFLIMASFALNIAFAGVWIAHAISAWVDEKAVPSPPATTAGIWCPLHQQLDVSDEQWQDIEPQLKKFRQSAQAVCQHVSKLRLEMLELIAVPTPDREAIAAKQKEIQAGQREMQGLVIGHLLAEKEILTPEQHERLLASIREHSGGPVRGGIGRVLRDGPQSE